jgi:hypothetical protein
MCPTFLDSRWVPNQTIMSSSGANGSIVRTFGRPSASSVMSAQYSDASMIARAAMRRLSDAYGPASPCALRSCHETTQQHDSTTPIRAPQPRSDGFMTFTMSVASGVLDE